MSDGQIQERTVFIERLDLPKQKVVEELQRTISDLYSNPIRGEYYQTPKSNAVKAVVQRPNGYEVTFCYPGLAELCQKRGLVFDKVRYEVVDSQDMDLTVTMENVPYYITDDVLIKKLENFGCLPLSPLKRLTINGVETGDRRLKLSKKGPIPKTMNLTSPTGRNICISIWHRDQV